MLKMTLAGCALGLTAVLVFTPLGLTPAHAADTGIEQVAEAGLQTIGTKTVNTPQGGTVEITQYMPELRDARIQGIAVPETSGPGDEIAIDLRTLVGEYEYNGETGELAIIPGAADRVPVSDPAGGYIIADTIDWSQFTWRIEGLPGTGVVPHLADDEGLLTLVPLQENTTFGATVTLVHAETGVESGPISITGQSGVNGSAADWLYTTDRALGDGNAPLWKANDRGFAEGKFLSWSDPEETTLASAATWTDSVRPWVDIPLSGRVQAPVSEPAGFGLVRYDQGHVQTFDVRKVARVGQAHSEPVASFSVDLAERLSDMGITALALPGAPDGTLSLDATAVWERPYGIGGLDYQAPGGLTLSADGTTINGEFGTAEWANAVGVTVFALTDAGVQAVELRVEARPADTSAGLVEKRVAVNTALRITDEEMLEASRLSGLEPTIREIRAMELPAGVERVIDGFVFEGASEPTALAFGFEVAETFDTPFGPVKPDATRAPGEVRIEVFEEAATPPTEEPPVVEPPVVEPPVVEPPTVNPPEVKPQTPERPRPDRISTGDENNIAVVEATEPAGQETPVLLAALGLGGVLGLAIGAGTIVARRLRRAKVTE